MPNVVGNSSSPPSPISSATSIVSIVLFYCNELRFCNPTIPMVRAGGSGGCLLVHSTLHSTATAMSGDLSSVSRGFSASARWNWLHWLLVLWLMECMYCCCDSNWCDVLLIQLGSRRLTDIRVITNLTRTLVCKSEKSFWVEIKMMVDSDVSRAQRENAMRNQLIDPVHRDRVSAPIEKRGKCGGLVIVWAFDFSHEYFSNSRAPSLCVSHSHHLDSRLMYTTKTNSRSYSDNKFVQHFSESDLCILLKCWKIGLLLNGILKWRA